MAPSSKGSRKSPPQGENVSSNLAGVTSRTKQGFTVSDGRVLVKINRQRNRIWLHSQAVKTPPSQGGDEGSIPSGVTSQCSGVVMSTDCGSLKKSTI